MPHLVSIYRLFVPRKYCDEVHEDADDEVMHVINGKVRVRLESGEEYTAVKNETLLIRRGVRHRDIFEEKAGLEVFIIHFRWGASKKFFAHAAPDCLKDLSSKDKNELLLLLDMFRLDQGRDPGNYMVSETRLAHLLGIAWRHVFLPQHRNGVADNYARLAAFAYDYMRGHLAWELTIDTVASALKISRATLVRVFARESNLSFNACLRSMRMNEAYYLLKERGMNVAECALRCGYADPAYFSRVFKKHFGFSPKNID